MEQAVATKTFPELVLEAQACLREWLEAAPSGLEGVEVRQVSSARGSGGHTTGRKAARGCRELFEMGERHGLTHREITKLLLHPLAPMMRPGLWRADGCSCPLCRHWRENSDKGGGLAAA